MSGRSCSSKTGYFPEAFQYQRDSTLVCIIRIQMPWKKFRERRVGKQVIEFLHDKSFDKRIRGLHFGY